MSIESTLALIKPDAYEHADTIETIISNNGFTIVRRESMTLTKERASEFYSEHQERFFFDDLIAFMTSGPLVAMVLCKSDAISAWRSLIGPTNVEKAKTEAPSSLRARFGSDATKNATHGSDAIESAEREIQFFFPDYVPAPQFNGADAKDYLSKTVTPSLVKALTEMCSLNPSNPLQWLGYRLLHTDKPTMEYYPQQNTKSFVVENHVNSDIDSDTTISSNGSLKKPLPTTVTTRKIYFVLGGPGSGKGTQCSQLVERFGFEHFSAGDLLRAEVASGSEQGVMIGDMIKEGKIVPGHITISLLKNAIEGSSAPGILIDGFPRQLDQAGAFEKDVSDFEFVLFFDCPEEEMERRLLERGKTSGRTDDNIESIRKRFKTFVSTSMPVISYYEAKGKVHRIDATKSIEQVTASVLKLF